MRHIPDPDWLAGRVRAINMPDKPAVEIMRSMGHKIGERTHWAVRKNRVKGELSLPTIRALHALVQHVDAQEKDAAA